LPTITGGRSKVLYFAKEENMLWMWSFSTNWSVGPAQEGVSKPPEEKSTIIKERNYFHPRASFEARFLILAVILISTLPTLGLIVL
jgi:hypothetical protein